MPEGFDSSPRDSYCVSVSLRDSLDPWRLPDFVSSWFWLVLGVSTTSTYNSSRPYYARPYVRDQRLAGPKVSSFAVMGFAGPMALTRLWQRVIGAGDGRYDYLHIQQ